MRTYSSILLVLLSQHTLNSGFEVIYRPLLQKEEISKITLKSPELGDFLYPLTLKGIDPTTAQRVISLKSQLGSELI